MYALTGKGMRYVDEYTIKTGVPSCVLMENAARGVVNEIEKMYPERDAGILIVCGGGNNGGDGLAIARWLLHLGYEISVYLLGEPDRLSPDFIQQFRIFRKMYPKFQFGGICDTESDVAMLREEYDVIVDAMFGTGLNRRLGQNYVKFLDYLNSKDAYKIAVDIPSGIHSATGEKMDGAFIADMTVTFGSYKIGMFLAEGRAHCGEIKVADIGLAESAYAHVYDKFTVCDNAFLDDTYNLVMAPRPEKSHKGTFGTVGIVVGPGSMMGASMLATKAAYRGGCGLVKIFCPRKYIGFFNVSIPEAVVVPYKTDDVIGSLEEFLKDIDVALVGPGLNEDDTGRLLVKHILGQNVTAVFDAGAVNLISKNLKSFRKRRCRCVLTPHLGEFARLCREDIKVVDRNKIAFLRKFSEKFRVSMVVKTDASLVSLLGEKEQKLFINTVGNSGLATAGSGDVLAGLIASLIAQGNSLNNSLLYGVMIHGRAAEKFAKDDDAKRKMMAGDIVENLF